MNNFFILLKLARLSPLEILVKLRLAGSLWCLEMRAEEVFASLNKKNAKIVTSCKQYVNIIGASKE